jgi:hypothetical protein
MKHTMISSYNSKDCIFFFPISSETKKFQDDLVSVTMPEVFPVSSGYWDSEKSATIFYKFSAYINIVDLQCVGFRTTIILL